MTIKLLTEAFKAGYSDTFYGIDKRENYKGQELIEYLSGMEDCIEDIQEEEENER